MPMIYDDLDLSPNISDSTNALRTWYNSFRNNSEAKRRLVQNDPSFAYRVFKIFEDRQLGEMFVERYKDDEKYHNDAFHIS